MSTQLKVKRNLQSQFWDERASNYADDFNGAPIRSFTTDHLVAFARERRPDTLLDLGGGVGIIAAKILEALPDVVITLVDSSEGMLTEARQRLAVGGEHRFVRSSLDKLPAIASDSINAAISSFAMHHIPDELKAEALCELRRVLAPDGYALIIDEVICHPAFEDEAKLFRHMGDLFYPWLTEEELARKFAGFQEYPTSLGAFVAMCQDAGFSVDARAFNGIVASVRLGPANLKG